jgi:TrmH family RNA methyltransferase
MKFYASLKHKKFRRENNLFIVEGSHLVQEALGSDWDIEGIIVKADKSEFIRGLKLPERITSILKRAEFDRISSSKTPQGVLAVVKIKSKDINSLILKARKVVVADNISDPGNLGTLIRSAAAFGYDLFVCVGKCAEVYNPKTVRATQGAIFTIPICEISSPQEFLSKFARRFKITVISQQAEMNLWQAPKISRPVLILGNEITGISPLILARADFEFKIEQTNRIESLNVAVAGGIAMYKFARGN